MVVARVARATAQVTCNARKSVVRVCPPACSHGLLGPLLDTGLRQAVPNSARLVSVWLCAQAEYCPCARRRRRRRRRKRKRKREEEGLFKANTAN